MPYRDRRDAGRQLAAHVAHYASDPRVLVLALPRGGVPVAYEVALALRAPLDVCIVCKLGAPGREELAIGAIASGGRAVFNAAILRGLDLPAAAIEAVVVRAEAEIARRELAYRHGRPAPVIRGRVVLLIDDGLATGATMRVAVRALRQQGPACLAVAVPLGAPGICAALAHEVDDLVCAAMPESFYAVGAWYDQFEQTTDDEVRALLREAARRSSPASIDDTEGPRT